MVQEFNGEYEIAKTQSNFKVYIDFVGDAVGSDLVFTVCHSVLFEILNLKFVDSQPSNNYPTDGTKHERLKHICLLDAVLCFLSGRIPHEMRLVKRKVTNYRKTVINNQCVTNLNCNSLLIF